MKTTIELKDELFRRAKRYAAGRGITMRQLVEESLQATIESKPPTKTYRLPDLAQGKRGASDPLTDYSWSDLRAEIYGTKE